MTDVFVKPIEAPALTLNSGGITFADGTEQLAAIREVAGADSTGYLSDGGSQNVLVAAGTGLIPTSNSDTAPLVDCSWGAADLALTGWQNNYIGVEYNSGSPQAVVRSENTFNGNDEFLLGMATHDDAEV